jgi:UDP-N-acetylmuramoyl-L-alanyl-D-glutamate--2,6-diaminopimelate ligase
MILLTELLKSIPEGFSGEPQPGVEIAAVVSDSRKVLPGSLFVAVSGGSVDGHRFIPDAIRGGAAAVIGEHEAAPEYAKFYFRVSNSRRALAFLAAAFHGHPARKLTMIGITGTDGKTTTSNLLYRILIEAGIKTGMVSTINALVGDEVLDTGFHVTTPDALDVQMYLSRMVRAGLTHVILETTSHGWAQYRVDACDFDIGIITNITHEHLDYHGSYDNYRAAKGRLFVSLSETVDKPSGTHRLAVLNRDDASYNYLEALSKVQKTSYGLRAEAEFCAMDITYTPGGVSFSVEHDGTRQQIECPLVGTFNVSNCLAAYTAAVKGLGVAPETAARGIAKLTSVPGRMERIDLGQVFTVIVDFAHTPNALQAALTTARQICTGRLIVVFGSAGLRDREKRRMMAELSAEFADFSIFTAEDPRTESLQDILEEMAAGAREKGGKEDKTFVLVPDRGEAIRKACKMAAGGDLVIVCGKGHEQSMCFGEIEYPWDDRIAMRAALSELLGLPAEKMPYLPTQN